MAATAPRQQVIDGIVRVLAPYLGANMARASVHGHCDKLGLGALLAESDVERLVAAIGPGLGVFVGRDKTALLLDEIRKGAGGGAK